MIYAAVLVCGLHGCTPQTYPETYRSEADCRAAHEARRPLVVLYARGISPTHLAERPTHDRS